MALVTVKKENRVLTIDERELERYLNDGYEHVRYDNRSGTYKVVTEKKTVNDAEFAGEITPQAAERNALDPASYVEFGAEITDLEAGKLGATPADVARAAGEEEPRVMRDGGVSTPAGANDIEFAGEIAPDRSPAEGNNTTVAAANAAANAAAGAVEDAEFAGEIAPYAAPNADYNAEMGEEQTPQKTNRKRKQ